MQAEIFAMANNPHPPSQYSQRHQGPGSEPLLEFPEAPFLKEQIIKLAYSTDSIANSLTANALKPLASKVSKKVLSILTTRITLSDCEGEEIFNMSELLTRYAHAIDEAYFYGLLAEPLQLFVDRNRSSKIVFISKKHEDWLNGSFGLYANGHANVAASDRTRHNVGVGTLCIFEVNSEMWPTNFLNFNDRLLQYLETLFHEMIHAFIDIYACQCWSGGCSWRANEFEVLGSEGHGIVFLEILAAMRDSARREMLWGVKKASDLKFGCAISLSGELHIYQQKHGKCWHHSQYDKLLEGCRIEIVHDPWPGRERGFRDVDDDGAVLSPHLWDAEVRWGTQKYIKKLQGDYDSKSGWDIEIIPSSWNNRLPMTQMTTCPQQTRSLGN